MKTDRTRSFEESLNSRITAHFTSRYGQKKPPIPLSYWLYYGVCIALGFLLPVVLGYKIINPEAPIGPLAFAVATIVSSIASSLTFMGFAHALSHNELFNQDKLPGRVLKFLTWDCLVTISEYVWDNVHNKSHHAFTNMRVAEVEKDLDVILITNNFKKHGKTLKILLLISIAQVIRFFRQFFSIYRLHKNYEKIGLDELIVIALGKVYGLAVYFILPCVAFESFWALGYGLLYLVVQSVILVPIFLIAHTTTDVKFYDVPGPKPYNTISFHQAQIESSANFSMHNRLMFWLTGGLTHQIEHHAFPDIHPHFYSEIAEIIQDECRKFGVHYHSYSSYREGVAAVMKYLCDGKVAADYTSPKILSKQA